MRATPPIRSGRNFTAMFQERSPAVTSRLLFFQLELNRLDEAALEKAMKASAALAHYRPWLEDLRKEKPYQLEDRLEQLFHEKAVTAARRLEPAVRRDHGARCASRSMARN